MCAITGAGSVPPACRCELKRSRCLVDASVQVQEQQKRQQNTLEQHQNLEKQQNVEKQPQIVEDDDEEMMDALEEVEEVTMKQDFLARSVRLQRELMEKGYQLVDQILAIPSIGKFCSSSQPAHLAAALSIGLVCNTFYSGGQTETQSRPAPLLHLVYLLSMALHFGAQFWMTFVSGLTLYFSLSRHAFGDVQQVLFPRYFTINSLLSCITLISFAKLHHHLPEWSTAHYTQLGLLSLGFVLETLARLYVAPKVVSAQLAVRRIELTVDGVGQEIGRHIPKCLATSPPYVAAHSAFRRYHSRMAIANVLAMSCSVAHVVYLAKCITFT